MRHLPFVELARQLGLISPLQYDEACRACERDPQLEVVDFLLDRGWLLPADRQPLEYLVGRQQQPADQAATEHADPGAPSSRPAARTVVNLGRIAPTIIHGSNADDRRGDEPLSSAPGDSEERYRFDAIHAAGGMGRVWRAWDTQLRREVAIKELHPQMQRSASLVERFLREARLTGQLEHPGVIPVHELHSGMSERGPYYAMRFVQGRTLQQEILEYHRGRALRSTDGLELVKLLAAFVAVCHTVAYAHSHRVIHRDLKGENVVLGEFGEVVVVDWGLAKLVDGLADDVAEAPAADFSDGSNSGLTVQGQVVGTPAYMSPEQAAGRLELVDQRTDIYSLGAILYEILAGRPPFVGSTTVEVLLAAQRGDPAPPHEFVADVPHGLEVLCLRALARDPAARFASATDLALEVQQWQETERQQAEAELRASRERFALAVEGSQDGLWDWDLRTNAVYFSPRWKSILGYEDHELANDVEEWIARLHPDEKEQVLAANYAHIHGTTQHYEYEYRLRHKDNSYRWILARGAALRDADGKAYRMAGSHVDVTDRRRTEQQLRDVEQLHQVTMQMLPMGIVVLDRNGTITFANPAAEYLCELPPAGQTRNISRSLLAHAVDANGERLFTQEQALLDYLAGREPSEEATFNVGSAADKPRCLKVKAASLSVGAWQSPAACVLCIQAADGDDL